MVSKSTDLRSRPVNHKESRGPITGDLSNKPPFPMNAETKPPNDAIVDKSTDPQSDRSDEFVKKAAHASWLAPILALVTEWCFSSAADSSAIGVFVGVGVGVVLTCYGARRGRPRPWPFGSTINILKHQSNNSS